MTTTAESVQTRPVQGRIATSRGLWTMVVALVLLAVAGLLFASTSMSKGALQGMLPFASVLAIVALGQTLVIQQGGFDLSVPGSVSIVVVICTHHPEGDNAKLLPAVLMALGVAVAAGLVNGTLIGRLRLNPIVATLGTNALLYAGVLGISAGSPRRTTSLLASIAGGETLGIPNAVFFALVAVAITTVAVKYTVVGRRFEAVGANPRAGRATGLKINRHGLAAYVWAQVLYWLGAVLLAGIIVQPTAFQGDAYLLAVGRGRRTRRHLATRWKGKPRRHRVGRAVPHPAPTVRSRSGCRLRHPDPGPSRRACARSWFVQRRLGGGTAAAAAVPQRRLRPPRRDHGRPAGAPLTPTDVPTRSSPNLARPRIPVPVDREVTKKGKRHMRPSKKLRPHRRGVGCGRAAPDRLRKHRIGNQRRPRPRPPAVETCRRGAARRRPPSA